MIAARYSLSSLFVIVTAVAVAIVFCIDWMSRGGEQQALEHLLLFVWISSLVVSYRKSLATGWRRVCQATIVTSVVWTVCIVSSHLMFASSMRRFRIEPWELLLRIVLIISAGSTAALLGGTFIHLAVCTGRRRWNRRPRRFVQWMILAFGGLTLLLAPVAIMVRDRYWVPSIVSRQEQPNPVAYEREEVRSKLQFHFATASPCKRLIVGLDGPLLFVVNVDTLSLVTQFKNPEPGRFLSASFFPDGESLAAVYLELGGGTRLVRWRTRDWVMQESIPLSALVGSEHLTSTFPILADHVLLLVRLTEDEAESSKLDISTIALNDRGWKPVEFASIEVPHVSWTTLRSPLNQSWSVSPDGSCIVCGPVFEQGRRSIIRRGAETPVLIKGRFLGFVPRGAIGVVAETTARVSLKKHVAADRPPFWDHFRFSGYMYRVSLVDFDTGESLLRSRWWSCSRPYLSESRLFVVASPPKSQDGMSLVWEALRKVQPSFSR